MDIQNLLLYVDGITLTKKQVETSDGLEKLNSSKEINQYLVDKQLEREKYKSLCITRNVRNSKRKGNEFSHK